MAIGRIPIASNCTDKRLLKVVLPDEEGPEISTIRILSSPLTMVSAN
jgi:hypothetical protein